ncbi:hypothetical protein [Blastococcus litoris]|uniref:hypothetical protein n=1 Tax=Blastococcus litoris TaxID=2171622 RepID=UPI001F13B230|nr:hypothetical protein [Blastococcus litoris]
MAVNPEDPRLFAVPRVEAVVPHRAASARSRLALVDSGVVEDTVNGAFAVLSVAGALGRYAAERALRRRPHPRLPTTRDAWGLARGVHASVARALIRPVSAAADAVSTAADELVPAVVRAVLARLDVPAIVREFVDLDRLADQLDVAAVVDRVDVDDVVAKVDIDAVLDRIDLDAIAARIDLDALVDRVDVARVIDRVDVDDVVAKVDIDAVLDRIDLDAIAARIDLDALVDRVDVVRIVDRVDLDAVVAGVDLDRAVDRVDVDRVIARTDLVGLARYIVQEIDLPGLLRTSTGSVTSEMARSVREQGADADRAVERMVDRLLHRQSRRTATADGGPAAGRGASRDH